jgi:hypothetical protein
VEKVVSVDVLQALHDLEKNALDAGIVQALVVAGLHQLIKVAFHVLHRNMEFLRVRVEKDVKRWDEMRVRRQRPQEDNFPKL